MVRIQRGGQKRRNSSTGSVGRELVTHLGGTMNGGFIAWLGNVWRVHFYDGSVKPRWQIHPHKRFGLVTRMILVSLGSTVPIGMALVGSGVLKRIEEGSQQVGLQFHVVVGVLVAAWIIGFIRAVASEQKDLTHYAALGSVYPANSFVVALALQAIT